MVGPGDHRRVSGFPDSRVRDAQSLVGRTDRYRLVRRQRRALGGVAYAGNLAKAVIVESVCRLALDRSGVSPVGDQRLAGSTRPRCYPCLQRRWNRRYHLEHDGPRHPRSHRPKCPKSPKAVAVALVMLVGGAGVRVLTPLLAGGGYASGVAVSQCLWIAAFALFLITYYPMLVKPRVDGQPG